MQTGQKRKKNGRLAHIKKEREVKAGDNTTLKTYILNINVLNVRY